MERGLAALTGGTGFLGRHLARALAADGWRVRLLARRDPTGVLGPGATPEAVLGDLADAAALRRLCDGADLVVHAAGRVRAPGLAAFRAANVDGARAVAAAALAARCVRFVLVSSLAAREPRLSPYARSKREGEEAVAAVLGEAARVVRPCAIYGPGDRETLALFRAAALSPVLPVLAPDARVTLVHVEDAARAVAAFAADPAPRLGPAALCDARPDGYGLREIMAAAAAAVGRRPRLVVAPDALLSAAGRLGDLAGRLGAPAALTSGKARELLHRDWSVTAEARWSAAPPPRFGLADGFGHTVAAHRAAGWLPPAGP